MKFAFIHAQKASHSVSALCAILGVTRQGYYAYAKRTPSARLARERELREKLLEVHDESRGTYGSPRMRQALARRGLRASKRRVERAMRAMGISVRSRRRFQVTTRANPEHAKAPNVLERDFTATQPNERWVADISYVWTDEGWCYLAVILDLFSRAVVGWSLDTTMTTELPLRALATAVARRRPEAQLLHHSDRGCQYTSDDYRRELENLGVVVSMSRKGNCWDNAVAESFFATIKTELVHRQTWTGRIELRAAVFDYIEVFYNRQRLHSTLGYRTPEEVETAYARAAA